MDFELWEEEEHIFCYQRNFVCKHKHTYAHTEATHDYNKSSRHITSLLE